MIKSKRKSTISTLILYIWQ